VNQEVSMRPSIPPDSDPVTRLIYLSMGIEADWLFGQEKGHPTNQVLTNLFLRRGNRISYPLSTVAERDEKVAGLLLAYPGYLLSHFNWMTGLHLTGVLGLAATIRLARRQAAYGDLKETEKDEFYISNLGVFPDLQGKGIGTMLMDRAEEMARKAGLQKCSLIVTFGHKDARRLYEHLGYKVIHSYSCNHPQVAEGSGGYHRMVKTLAPLPASG
jgi:ribosomal protein S18 acetylase RimI-like enzyme